MESMEFDVVIVGAGASGLSSAIRIKQLAAKNNKEISVCIVEKGSEVGAHILSGAVLEPRALDELIPDWKEKGAPVTVGVKKDHFMLLGRKGKIKLPTPPQMKNHGNYIISLGNLCRWLGEQATSLGVEIFPGFPASDVIIEEGQIKGIITGEFGRGQSGAEKYGFQPSMEVRGKYTIFAEGCRGSLAQKLEEEFDLRKNCDPQTYGIGMKELWEIPAENHKEGEVYHSVGWPLDAGTYGGSFLYHGENNTISIGFVIGLDYENTYLNPYEEFQKFKTHPTIRKQLEGGKRISYGARALNEGGLQSIPEIAVNGAVIVGCSAGFLNVPKIKGTHTAMKSGMLAAESIYKAITEENPDAIFEYSDNVQNSWICEELYKSRNIRPSFRIGLFAGLFYSAIDTFVLKGKAPWTFRHKKKDNESFSSKNKLLKIEYPEPDGKVSFDLMSSVYLSNTNHEEDQPIHLKLKDKDVPIDVNLEQYDSPEVRFCPAGVYEIVDNEGGEPELHINAQNCLHCKTCDIKDPTQNICWTTPEGGGGPNYPGM